MAEPSKRCPCCGKDYRRVSALSRVDGKTEICPACGTAEALDALPNLDPQIRASILEMMRIEMEESK